MFPLDYLLPDLKCINKTMLTYFIVINLRGGRASTDPRALAFVIFYFYILLVVFLFLL